MPELENINLIDGQPVSEFGYLTYQFWKSELKQTLFLVVFSLSLFFGAL